MIDLMLNKIICALGNKPSLGFLLSVIQSILGFIFGKERAEIIFKTIMMVEWKEDVLFIVQVLAYLGAALTAALTVYGWIDKRRCAKAKKRPSK